jgi:hypothetical protein
MRAIDSSLPSAISNCLTAAAAADNDANFLFLAIMLGRYGGNELFVNEWIEASYTSILIGNTTA